MVEKVESIHLEKVGSTNTYAKEHYADFDLSKITCITADEQTSGRGRFNRPWTSPKGVNIYLSFFFTLKKGKDLNNLAQILALSIANMLQKEGLTPQIKWPNDLLINRKKIAGILCEVVDLKEDFGVILGAGINVNMEKKECDQIDQPATSFLIEGKKIYNRDILIDVLQKVFIKNYELYKQKGFNPFYTHYDALLLHKGESITLKQNGESLSGILHSLNPDGRLNLLLPSGEIKTLSSGDIKK